jgi:hypothetical protein
VLLGLPAHTALWKAIGSRAFLAASPFLRLLAGGWEWSAVTDLRPPVRGLGACRQMTIGIDG